MVWQQRKEDRDGSAGPLPQYASGSTLFTIKLHHGGKFVRDSDNELQYVGGTFTLFDDVDKDKISTLELADMILEVGIDKLVTIYYSCTNSENPNGMIPIYSDNDSLETWSFRDKDNCVGIWCDHEMKPESEITGIVVDWDGVTNLDAHIEVGEVDDDYDLSIGSDSNHSEFYNDSDGNYDVDNDEFDKYVDLNLEWCGLITKVNRKEIGETKVCGFDVAEVNDPLKKNVYTTYKGHEVYIPKKRKVEVVLGRGMHFNSMEEMKDTIRKHSIEHGREICWPMVKTKKLQAKCVHDNCGWYVYGSRGKNDVTFAIKTLGPDHTCPRLEKVTQATSTWLEKEHRKLMRLVPDLKISSMQQYFQEEHELLFSESQMYRLKKKALNRDQLDAQFGLVYRYAEEIFRSNPGSTVKIKTISDGPNNVRFERLYICWNALKLGMLSGCRRIIFLDGTHVKGSFGGILLTACGLDANNGIYPFAYALVEKERIESWSWFMEILVADLGIEKEQSYLWTVMSDKQKGLIEGIKQWLPHCELRHCVYHLYQNFNLVHKGLTLKELLWRAAKSTRPCDFERIMTELKSIDHKAFDWLSGKPPAQWSKAFFGTINCSDVLLNNISESFNSLLVTPRTLPFLEMLEAIRMLLMKRVAVRRMEMMSYDGELCPKAQQLLNHNHTFAFKYRAEWNGHNQFQVTGLYHDAWTVNIGDRTCSCRRWQLTGIPCGHAIQCFLKIARDPKDYVDACYKRDTFLNTYGHFLNPMVGKEEWPEYLGERLPVKAPLLQKMPGRPKKYNRRLQPGEKKRKKPIVIRNKLSKHGVIMSCSVCKDIDHNKATCPKLHPEQDKKAQEAKAKATKSKTTKANNESSKITPRNDKIAPLESQELEIWEDIPDYIFMPNPRVPGSRVRSNSLVISSSPQLTNISKVTACDNNGKEKMNCTSLKPKKTKLPVKRKALGETSNADSRNRGRKSIPVAEWFQCSQRVSEVPLSQPAEVLHFDRVPPVSLSQPLPLMQTMGRVFVRGEEEPIINDK